MTKPLDPNMIEHINFNLKKLLCLDLKNMRSVRFWGKASNTRFKNNNNNYSKKAKNPKREINGEVYKFVGVVSQMEFDEETEGKTLSCTSEGFILVIDDIPGVSTG